MAKEIVANPKIIVGKPVIKGTRIPVYLVLNLLANGYTHERIIKAYPQLTERDIKAALEYAQARVKYKESEVLSMDFIKSKSSDSDINGNVVIDYDKKGKIVRLNVYDFSFDDFKEVGNIFQQFSKYSKISVSAN